eukprot:scaffold154021_cov41-Attheya_sp.AAC.1
MMRRTVLVLLVWIHHAAWAFISPGRPLAIIHSDIRMRIRAAPPIPKLPRVGGLRQEPKNNSANNKLRPFSFFEIFGKHKKNLQDEEKVEDDRP